MEPSKSPGPDGYIAYFSQAFWSTIGDDISEAALSYLNGVQIEKRITTYIERLHKSKSIKTYVVA